MDDLLCDDDAGFTIMLNSGHIAYDYGYFAPILDMFDDTGELTSDPEEAVAIAFETPSDQGGAMITIIDLRELDELGYETFH